MIKAISLFTPCYVSLFWGIVLLVDNKMLNNSQKFLGIFMLCESINFFTDVVFYYGHYHFYIFFESLCICVRLVLYPLFYTYILILSTREIKKTVHLLHFLPGILLGIISFCLTIKMDAGERICYTKTLSVNSILAPFDLEHLIGYKDLVFRISRFVFIAQSIIYSIIGILVANKYNRLINDFLSDTENRKMLWVRNLSIIVLVSAIPVIVWVLLGRKYFVEYEMLLNIPSFFISSILFVVGFMGNKQRSIPDKLPHLDADFTGKKNDNEAKIPVNNTMKMNFINLFEHEKIYCQSDLRISIVAEMLHTNRTYVSRLINTEFGINFNEFVNQYRVNDAKQLMLSGAEKKYTQEYIAEQSGFGSVASFLRVFKEMEGMTPGKYMKLK